MEHYIDHYLSSFIYGGLDGIITTIALISGSLGSNQSVNTVLILTLTSLLSDGLSMGYGSYESHLDKYGYQVAAITFISFVLLGVIPLLIYINSKNKERDVFISLIILLYIVGYIKAKYKKEIKPHRYASKTMILGTLVSIVAYYSAHYISNKIN